MGFLNDNRDLIVVIGPLVRVVSGIIFLTILSARIEGRK